MIDGGGTINGVPVKNIGNWGEVKAQAANLLGIALVDSDIFNIPLIAADPYGRFLAPDSNGFPMMIMGNGAAVRGQPAGADLHCGRAPDQPRAPRRHRAQRRPAPRAPCLTGTMTRTRSSAPRPTGMYDDELLAAHFLTGDGRGNENIALTAGSHRLPRRAQPAARFIIDGLISSGPDSADGAEMRRPRHARGAANRAARLRLGLRRAACSRRRASSPRCEYQHLVFEEFARKMVPSINPFVGDGINFAERPEPGDRRRVRAPDLSASATRC